ncbi:MAG: hypothetical protein IJS51_07670 [Treponema sp.]|nr:hypothetical protein [Treponema sp.]
MPGDISVNIIYIKGDSIGNDKLLEHSPREEFKAVGSVAIIKAVDFIELRDKASSALDRAACNSWKKAYKKRDIERIALSRYFLFVNVRNITDALKCEKGYSQRKNDVWMKFSRRIFKEQQRRETNGDKQK